MSARSLHRRFAAIFAFPFLFVFLTGFFYRISRNLFGYEKSQVSWLLQLHYMKFYGLEAFYPIMVGLSTFFLLGSGFPLTRLGHCLYEKYWNSSSSSSSSGSSTGNSRYSNHQSPLINFSNGFSELLPQNNSPRSLHRYFASWVAFPLFLTASTGILFSIRVFWLGEEKSSPGPKFLLYLHQGSYLGNSLYYMMLLGIFLFPMILTGISMIQYPWWKYMENHIFYRILPQQWFSSSSSSSNRSSMNREDSLQYTILSVNRAFDLANHEKFSLTSEEDENSMDNSRKAPPSAIEMSKTGGESEDSEN